MTPHFDAGLEGRPEDPGRPCDVVDLTTLRLRLEGLADRDGAVVELDLLVVDDQDLLEERPVLGHRDRIDPPLA